MRCTHRQEQKQKLADTHRLLLWRFKQALTQDDSGALKYRVNDRLTEKKKAEDERRVQEAVRAALAQDVERVPPAPAPAGMIGRFLGTFV